MIDNTKIKNPVGTGLVLVTPDYAKEILATKNSINRRLNPMRVDTLVQIILNNQWQITHQGVAFDIEGNLVDGQHRLAAIAKAGVPVKILVSYNLEPESRLVVDSGAPRTLGNRITLAGYEDISSKSIAVARILEYGVVAASQKSLSAEEAVRIVMKYHPAIKFALSCGHGRGYTAIIQAAIARASCTLPHDKLKRFVEVFISEVPSDRGESAALKLKRAVTDKRVVASALQHTAGYAYTDFREYVYGLAENAIIQFVKGKEVLALRPKITAGELFPLP